MIGVFFAGRVPFLFALSCEKTFLVVDFVFGTGIDEDGPAVLVSDPVVVLELGVVPVLLDDDNFGGIVLAILIRVS
jgi:hypothetical protein